MEKDESYIWWMGEFLEWLWRLGAFLLLNSLFDLSESQFIFFEFYLYTTNFPLLMRIPRTEKLEFVKEGIQGFILAL